MSNLFKFSGTGCGSVGKVVKLLPPPKDPRFESSHWQILFTIVCIKTCVKQMKIKKKWPGMVHCQIFCTRVYVELRQKHVIVLVPVLKNQLRHGRQPQDHSLL